MLISKKTQPILIGKLIKPENSGHRNLFTDEITSPKSPLDFKIKSPKGIKNCAVAGGGVGLGILAALEKSNCNGGNEIQMKFIVPNLNLNFNRGSSSSSSSSSTVPIRIGSNNNKCREILLGHHESESYTYVTCHRPNKKSFTRVYFDDHGGSDHHELSKFDDHDDNNKLKISNMGIFYESPPRFTKSNFASPTSDFLSSCYLCMKKLGGKDIFMYRGEKAFCSAECRYTQIVNDERKEKCRSDASRYGDISISSYSDHQLFSTGITAS